MSESSPPENFDPDAAHLQNISAENLRASEAEPFENAAEHLRAEVWRVWLRVEYEIRQRWEWRALPRVSADAGVGLWKPNDVAGLFRAALSEFRGHSIGREDLGADTLRDAYVRHSAKLELRVQKSFEADVELPLIDLVRNFRLDARQRAALMCAIAPEVDPNILVAYRYLTHDPSVRHLDGRILSILVYDTLASRAKLARDLSSSSPLIRYRLLEHDESSSRHDSILYRRLRPAGRLIHGLAGGPWQLDPELATVVSHHHDVEEGLFPEQEVAITRAVLSSEERNLLIVSGPPGVGKRMLVGMVGSEHGGGALMIDGPVLANTPARNLEPLIRSILREAKLLDAIPVVPALDDLDVKSEGSTELPRFLSLLCDGHEGPVAITLVRDKPPSIDIRSVAHVTLGIPNRDDRVTLWQRRAPHLDEEDAQILAERFAIPGGVIDLAVRSANAVILEDDDDDPITIYDRAVRAQLHGRIQRLGVKLETPSTFDDLVTDEETLVALREISMAVQERHRVRGEWGFKGAPGISVLLSGPPGVGKTMAATVVARELDLAIYEIDLSQIVSKWIGETEKNLAQIFDAAEPGHVVLLFNEADSLFGKRTNEVGSSNDRFANMQTNYLLQRLERFGGLSILTTNLTKAIDAAFRRRFAYDVRFAFPTAEMRAELWRRSIPAQASTAELDHEDLAERFELTGGYIKVASERTAYKASALGRPIDTELLVETIESMYRERGKLSPVGRLE